MPTFTLSAAVTNTDMRTSLTFFVCHRRKHEIHHRCFAPVQYFCDAPPHHASVPSPLQPTIIRSNVPRPLALASSRLLFLSDTTGRPYLANGEATIPSCMLCQRARTHCHGDVPWSRKRAPATRPVSSKTNHTTPSTNGAIQHNLRLVRYDFFQASQIAMNTIRIFVAAHLSTVVGITQASLRLMS